jgi:hypothetical protein
MSWDNFSQFNGFFQKIDYTSEYLKSNTLIISNLNFKMLYLAKFEKFEKFDELLSLKLK